MRHRSVSDLMTPTAVSVQRGTTFKEIARLWTSSASPPCP